MTFSHKVALPRLLKKIVNPGGTKHAVLCPAQPRESHSSINFSKEFGIKALKWGGKGKGKGNSDDDGRSFNFYASRGSDGLIEQRAFFQTGTKDVVHFVLHGDKT